MSIHLASPSKWHPLLNAIDTMQVLQVGYVGSWSRVGPFLPWMEMGTEEGGLVYSAPFVKLSDVDQLPSQLLGWMIENYPDYLHPPRNYTVPNMWVARCQGIVS